ncbi:MAG TPA: hypothetical protein VII99_15245, partial [Bacteroidia bacterium]
MMKKYVLIYIYIYFIVLVAFGCSLKQEKISNEKFKIPKINFSLKKDSLRTIDTDSINGVFTGYYGKYSFSDSINLNDSTNKIKRDEIFYETRSLFIQDSINSDGFQVIADYSQTIPEFFSYNYGKTKLSAYPVFIINETDKDKLFIAKDGYAFAIQEAKDRYEWYPIEEMGFDFCGNGG